MSSSNILSFADIDTHSKDRERTTVCAYVCLSDEYVYVHRYMKVDMVSQCFIDDFKNC
jgi:hypothetical protein